MGQDSTALGIAVHVEETKRAAELYNKLAESERVGTVSAFLTVGFS